MRLGFLLLIGLPGSGKTTLAKNLIKHFENNENICNFVHICYDDFITFPSGKYDFEWKSARRSVSVKVESLVIAIKTKNVNLCPLEFKNRINSVKSWEGDFVLILDDNMYFRSMRYSLFQIAKKHSISFCQIYLNCPLETALLKNKLREPNSVVPPNVIKSMHSKIEPPNCKNVWEKYSLELNEFCNMNKINYKIFHILNDSLNNVFCKAVDDETKELSKIQCKKSVLHQSDLALRKLIGSKIKKFLNENSKEPCKDYSAELNLRKSELLLDIKVGNICLSDDILMEINSDDAEKIQLISFLHSYF